METVAYHFEGDALEVGPGRWQSGTEEGDGELSQAQLSRSPKEPGEDGDLSS